MSLASRFNRDLCTYLDRRVPSYKWKPEYRIDKSTREAVDVGGQRQFEKKLGNPPVLIEAELKREDPAGNILKIWSRLMEGDYRSGVILVQGFSQVYRSSKYHNRRLKASVAKKLGALLQASTRGKLRYIPIDMPYHPRAGRTDGNGARLKAARRFGEEIARIVRKNH